jgi:hypothetical protein
VPRDAAGGSHAYEPPRPPDVAAVNADQAIVSGRGDARRRVAVMLEHARICRELEKLASLVEYYRTWWVA